MARSEIPTGILAIHSQSNRPDAPLNFNNPEEQAFDSRALTLPNVDVLAISAPLEDAYINYYKNVLGLQLPKLIAPRKIDPTDSLSDTLNAQPETIEEIKRAQERSGKRFILSVFDPTDSEKQLLHNLQQAGIDVIPEVNYDVASRLGNKAGFREFCQKFGLPQVSGGVFKTMEDLKAYINRAKTRRTGLIIKHTTPVGLLVKHPNGTAGEGITRVQAGTDPSPEDLIMWKEWMDGAGSVVAEEFHPKVEDGKHEHALHIYIDPVTKKAKVVGIYDQLTEKNDKGTRSHKGAITPMANKETRRELLRLAKKKIIPALKKLKYTGPACFDVLSEPLHFMELNTRAGANYYAQREAEQVAQYYPETHTDAFHFIASIEAPHDEANFSEFYAKYQDVLQPQENGTLIFTNPSRHKFKKYDIVAYSPYGLAEAQKILRNGVVKIWGEEKAAEILGDVYTEENK